MNHESQLIFAFYLGTGTDHMGRSLLDILGQDEKWLEGTHDYIQWLFPLYVSSRFNPHAPILTDEVREAFLDPTHPLRAQLQANFSMAIDRMFLFYGFVSRSPFEADDVTEILGRQFGDLDGYPLQFHPWMAPGNHNQLRITRMLRCMTLLGRHKLAVSFRNELVFVGKEHLSPQTIKFWDEAVVPVTSIE